MSALARRYGASPWHLLGHAVLLALAAWAIGHVLDLRGATSWLVWFLGAALLHDLLFLPAYVALDRTVGGASRPRAWVNHVRVPAVLSGVLLLVWFPLILGLSGPTLEGLSGRTQGDERLRDWLVLTAALFAGSALLWLRRRRRVGDDLGGGGAQDGEPPGGGVDAQAGGPADRP